MKVKTDEARADTGMTPSTDEARADTGMTPSNLGILRFKADDGKIYNFQGNRAQRRRFIREHKLVRGASIPPVR